MFANASGLREKQLRNNVSGASRREKCSRIQTIDAPKQIQRIQIMHGENVTGRENRAEETRRQEYDGHIHGGDHEEGRDGREESAPEANCVSARSNQSIGERGTSAVAEVPR